MHSIKILITFIISKSHSYKKTDRVFVQSVTNPADSLLLPFLVKVNVVVCDDFSVVFFSFIVVIFLFFVAFYTSGPSVQIPTDMH